MNVRRMATLNFAWIWGCEMSNKLQGMAWGLPLPANAKLVLVALADAASDDEGVCWIGNSLLRAKASVSKTSLTYILSAFQAIGIIRRDPRFRENGGQSSSFKYLTIPVLKKEEEDEFLEKYNIAYAAARISKKPPCHAVTGGEGSPSDTGGITLGDHPRVTQSDHQEPLVYPLFEIEEEDGVCEVVVVSVSSSLPALVIPMVMEHLPTLLVEQAIDKAVTKLATRSPSGYRRRLLEGLAAGDQGWIETVSEFIKQVQATSEAPWKLEERMRREDGERNQLALINCGFTNPGEAYAATKASREGMQDDF